jgi:hypothetical protein
VARITKQAAVLHATSSDRIIMKKPFKLDLSVARGRRILCKRLLVVNSEHWHRGWVCQSGQRPDWVELSALNCMTAFSKRISSLWQSPCRFHVELLIGSKRNR